MKQSERNPMCYWAGLGLCTKCSKFKPGAPDNCAVAQIMFDNCARFKITAPIVKCDGFVEYKNP